MSDSVKEMADAISSFVNRASSSDIIELGKMMTRDHRTLQQSKMQMVIAFLEEMSVNHKADWFDLRNEQASQFASKVIDATDETDRCMPLI